MTVAAMAAGKAARRIARRKVVNRLMLGLSAVAALLAVTPLLWIVGYVILRGAPAINLEFLTALPTPVGIEGGGIANAIVGSFMIVGLGVLLAAPLGLLGGMYAAARPHSRLGVAIRFATDTLAGVPSIVMGIFAYTIVVLPQGHFSALAGAVVLAFIMLPILVRTTEEMLKLVPSTLREGSLALGAAEWRTSLRVLIPAAINGILTGVMLAVARAAGEAAPMLFTAFGNPFMNTDLNQPTATLPHTVFTYAISPYPDWQAKAWATALVLIVIVLTLNVGARLITSWRARRMGALRP
jgi:phosphate transport system permease protein